MRRRARWWWTRARDGGVGVGRGEVVTGDERAHGDARARDARGWGVSAQARAPDFPLVTSFYLERAPDDAALETFARCCRFPSSGVERRRRTRGARRRFGGCVGSAWTMEGG